MRCGEWARARESPLLRLTEHADPHATGIVMCAQSRSKAMGRKLIILYAQFLQRLVCSASGGRGACSRHARPKRRFAVALGRLASPHWQRKKSFTYRARTAVAPKPCHTTHTIPLAASTSNSPSQSCQSRPAKRARDGIEWILPVPARPSRHPSVCARAESMTFRLFFVWPYNK